MIILLEDKVAGGGGAGMTSYNLIFKELHVSASPLQKHCDVGSNIFLIRTTTAVMHKLFHLHLRHGIHGVKNAKDLDSNEISGLIVKPRITRLSIKESHGVVL
jgi:hypothetical protein